MSYNMTCAQILDLAGITWDVEWALDDETYFPVINGHPVYCDGSQDRWRHDSGTIDYDSTVAPSLIKINGSLDYFGEFYRADMAIPHKDPSTISESGPDDSVFLRFNADGTFEAGFKHLILRGDPSLTFGEFLSMAADIARMSSHNSEWGQPVVPGLTGSIWDEDYCDEIISKGGTFEDYCLEIVWNLNNFSDIIYEADQNPNKVVEGINRLFGSGHPGISVKVAYFVSHPDLDPKYIDNGAMNQVHGANKMIAPDVAADGIRSVAKVLNSNPTYQELASYYQDQGWYSEDTLKILFG